ncbi:hypothetical protein Taro_053008 [Colocasia esculenta]|uniref:Uncharacterized protein n=1 Tax=Colocasia esculenta TaxID=4460 RepID=A0A843XLB2_COLES|nr:hypothetical protein [Colocasia esculenta]
MLTQGMIIQQLYISLPAKTILEKVRHNAWLVHNVTQHKLPTKGTGTYYHEVPTWNHNHNCASTKAHPNG